jgi:uncharacterized membrane protein
MRENLNAGIVLVGFVALEAGIAQWSGALAAVIGGGLLMALGSWPYLIVTLRRRG